MDQPRQDVPMQRSRSRSRSPLPPSRPQYNHSRSPSYRPAATTPRRILGIFGLSMSTRESDLHAVFSPFGTVERCTIVHDKRSDRSRGFGFVYFEQLDHAIKAVAETNGMVLQGRKVRVDFSKTDRPHEPTPGRYMGEVRRNDYDDRRGSGGGGYRRRSRSRSRSRDRYRRRSRSRDEYRSRHDSYYGSRNRSPQRRRYNRSRSVDRSRYSPRHYSPSPVRRYSPARRGVISRSRSRSRTPPPPSR